MSGSTDQHVALPLGLRGDDDPAARVVAEPVVVLDPAHGLELAPVLGQPPLQLLDGERGPRGRVQLGVDGAPVAGGEVAHGPAAAARVPQQKVQELGVVLGRPHVHVQPREDLQAGE